VNCSEHHTSCWAKGKTSVEVPPIQAVHEGSITADENEEVLKESKQAPVLIKADYPAIKDLLHHCPCSGNFVGGHSDEPRGKEEVEPKPLQPRLLLPTCRFLAMAIRRPKSTVVECQQRIA